MDLERINHIWKESSAKEELSHMSMPLLTILKVKLAKFTLGSKLSQLYGILSHLGITKPPT